MVMKFGCIKRLFFAILMLFLSVSLVCAERLSFDQFYDLVLNYLGENDEGDG